MDETGVLIKKLNKILDSIRKNPNRKFRLTTLVKKLSDAKDTYNNLVDVIQLQDEIEQNILIKVARNLYGEIKTLLDQKLCFPKLISFKSISIIIVKLIQLHRKTRMATIMDIVKTIPQLIPSYNGDGEKLNSTVAALTACKSLLTEATTPIALQVILSRLEGKARAAVGENPRNIDEIIEKLKQKCKITIQPETVVAKLNATKQESDVTKFTDQVEKLTLELERAYINEQIPVETAARMSVKAGIKALASGIKSEEIKLILKAGQFNSLTSAIEKITENSSNASNQILHVRSNNSGNRGNNYGYRGNFQNQRGRQRGNDRNFRGRSQQSNYQQNNNYSGGNNRGYYRGNGRGNNRGNYHNNNSRVFYNSLQPHQMLQAIQGPQNNLGFQQAPPQQQQNQVVLAQPQQNQVALAQLVPRR